MDNINSRQVWYSLRRTLPPWNFQQMLDDVNFEWRSDF